MVLQPLLMDMARVSIDVSSVACKTCGVKTTGLEEEALEFEMEVNLFRIQFSLHLQFEI